MQNNFKVLITDYAWSSLEPERKVLANAGSEIIVAETGDETELLTHAPIVDGILTCWKPVREPVIVAALQCQIIARYGIGLDNIDVDVATENGIIVTNVPTYCVDEVSDHAMALILTCSRKIIRYNKAVKDGAWDQNIGQKMYRLRGKTLGIVGMGNIAKSLIPKAKAFGLVVNVYSPRTGSQVIKSYGVNKVTFDELLKTSDYVSIHAPLTAETHHMFGVAEFRAMKPTAYLINTARGGILDTEALFTALQNKEMAGAGLDVLETEPPKQNEKLLELENVIMTPHAAFISEESILELQIKAATCVVKVLNGKLPDTVVNPSVLNRSNLRSELLRQ